MSNVSVILITHKYSQVLARMIVSVPGRFGPLS